MKKRAFLLLAFLLPVGYVQAQRSLPDETTYWFSMGLGKANHPSAMFALGLEPAHKQRVITARYSISGEIYPAVQPTVKVNELGLLYGIRLGKFSFSTGLSALWGNNRGAFQYTDPDPLFGGGATYDYVGYTTVGIPGEIRFMTSAKHVGIGITGFGNLNEKHPFVGLNVSLYVGKLRNTGLPSD